MSISNTKIHQSIGFKKTSIVKELCRPLVLQNEIAYFIYTANYSDSSRIYLCDKPDWFVAYHERLFSLGASNLNHKAYSSSIVLWSDFQNQEIFHIAKKEFNMNFPVLLINRSNAGCEIAIFGLNDENPNQFNLKLLNSLRSFLFYFKDKGRSLIRQAQQDRKLLPKARSLSSMIADYNKNNFHLQSLDTKTKRFYIGNSNQFLSSNEIRCIQLCFRGLTAKQIGTCLHISQRTVETHFERAKLKLSANNKFELLRKSIQLGIIPDFFGI